MPLQAFIDDSGGKGQGPVFVLAGLIGEAKEWADFSTRWRRALHSPPRIEHFKMHDAAHRRGQFARFSKTARNAKVERLVRVVDRYGFRFIQVVTDLAAHAATFGAHAEKPKSDPYFLPFHVMIMAVLNDVLARPRPEPFEICFDEQMIFGPRAKAWYPSVRYLHDDEEQRILPVEPSFRSDAHFMPLQAADFFAWMFRRAQSGGDVREFGWIFTDVLKNTKVSRHCQVLDRVRLERILRMTAQVNMGIDPEEIDQGMIRRYRRLMDQL